jgi:hypothetical protein
MEYLRRKCVCCHKLSFLSCFKGDYKTCTECLEKAREKYRDDPGPILKRCKKYRDNNTEKEKERHRLYYHNNKEIIDEKKKYIIILNITALYVYIMLNSIEKINIVILNYI